MIPTKSTRMKKLLPLTLLLFSLTLFSQKSEEQLLRIPYTSEVDNSQREYFLYLPKGYNDESEKKWPVLLFLHGNGERGNGKDELDYVLIHGPLYEGWIQKRDLPFIMIAPQLHMFGQDTVATYIANRTPDQIPIRLKNGVPKRPGYFGTSGKMNGVSPNKNIPKQIERFPVGWEMVEQDVMNILEYTLENYNTDNHRVYLSGISYGGVGTFYIGSKNIDKFAALNPIVGWGSPKLMKPIATSQTPIWIFAAGLDSAVYWENFYEGVNKLKELGHNDVRFTIHQDLGHDAWKRIYEGEDIYKWFLKQQK